MWAQSLDGEWSRTWQPTPVFLPGKFHRQRTLASSVQFSHSVVSNSFLPSEPQHTRPPYPSPTAGVYLNLSPLSR